MKRPLYLLLTILSLNVLSVSAQKYPHTLLWRISGRNGEKPSYLYGTMHLTDERLFNLGDSLYAAIKQSDGFATELDPDDLSAFVIEEVKKEIVDAQSIHDLLSDKDYKVYAPRLAKKLKKSPDKITTQDILLEKNKWMQDSYRTGKMKTFLDIYLYDIARRQGKWTGGIEDMDDQRGLIRDIVDKSDIEDVLADDSVTTSREAERMIAFYTSQDLEGIDSFSNQNRTDPVMLRRNKKMSARIDSLSSIRSMVFAVGAAHLPGEQGLIELLRKKGFRVDPVFSDKHIQASQYKVQEIPIVWNPVTDENGLYQASMPGKPGNIQLYGVLNMKMYIDFFNGTGYFTTAVRSAMNIHGTDSMINAMASNLFPSKSRDVSTPITLNGSKGRMYSLNDKEGVKKGMILVKDGVIYVAMGTSMKADSQQMNLLDRFLAGFKVLDIIKKDPSFNLFSDSVLAFRIEVPGKPQPYNLPKSKDREGWDSKMYMSVDNQEGVYYLFGANSVKPGKYIDNDSTFLVELKNKAQKNLSLLSSDTSFFSNDNRIVEFSGKMKAADAWMTARYIARGNRWYGLAAIYPTAADSVKIVRFLQSFALLNYPSQNWQYAKSPDTLISSWTPAPIRTLKKDSSDDASIDSIYNSFDSSRSNTYSILTSHLNPYYWISSDSAFWAERVARHFSKTDSVIYKKPISNGDAKGWEWVKLKKNSTLYERQRLLLDGDELYSLYVSTPRKEIFSDNTNRFFEEFRFQKPPAKMSYTTPKAELLMTALFSDDSARAATAFEYLDNAPFEKSDLPLLHRSFFKRTSFKGYWLNSSQINDAITERILLLKDGSSFTFAAEKYRTVPDSGSDLKNNLLRIMAAFPDSAHFAQMATLLSVSPPRDLLSYYFLRRLQDTMELTARVMPKLLPLLSDSLVGPSIINLSASLLDSGRLSLGDIIPYQANLLHYAGRRAKVLAKEPGDYSNDLALINLLGRLNNPKSNAALNKFLSAKENYLRIKAIEALLGNKQLVDPSVYLRLAKDKGSRITLYKALLKVEKASQFPAEYRTQKRFAESKIYDQASEDEEPSSLVFLKTKSAVINRGKKMFYFYKVQVDDDGSYYLACAGPYDTDPLKLNVTNSSAMIDYEEEFSAEQMEEQMNKLIRKFSEEEKK